MKTVWILDHHASEPEHNGIARHYDFARALGEQGVNVVVISSSYSHFTKEYFKDDEITVSQISDNARFVYIRTTPEYSDNGNKRFQNMISYVNLVKKYRKKIAEQFGNPDAVVGCSIHPLAWIAAYRVSRKFNCKFFIEVRDFWPLFFVESKKYSNKHPIVLFFGRLEKWAYRKAQKIIVSLPFAEKYISGQLGFPKEKIEWIGQPMDTVQFDTNAQQCSTLIPNEIIEFINNSFVCIFTGYYKEYEGVLTMLEAAKILKSKQIDVKMLFVGNGSAESSMHEYITKNELDNVLIGPRIPKKAVPYLLKRSRIKMASLFTEDKNAFSYGISKNKINEYLYSGGCTIFGFAQPHSAVELSKGGFVIEPGQPDILADTIERVVNMSEDEFETISTNARSYIEELHDVRTLAEKFRNIIFS